MSCPATSPRAKVPERHGRQLQARVPPLCPRKKFVKGGRNKQKIVSSIGSSVTVRPASTNRIDEESSRERFACEECLL